MKITEAIILAGGLGTRLRSAVPDLPKCMAPVAGKPFLSFVIHHCMKQGIERFIFSLGYKHKVIEKYVEKEFEGMNGAFCVEEEPLGTGGAIQMACEFARTNQVMILNGDTLFSVNAEQLATFHFSNDADCTLSLKPMKNIDRYGVVEVNDKGVVTHFKEKQFYESGNINGGIYALNVERFLARQLPPKFSFEKDYLEAYISQHKFYGLVQDEYFIDIGIPEDYEKANTELANLKI